MKLEHGRHLAYCTNIHKGETWDEVFQALKDHTMAVRDGVDRGGRFAIGLRLSAAAARELADRKRLVEFQRWLDAENCYVFTINGFPYGQFHGTRVKEKVYAPDWTSDDRVLYTNQLFDLLSEILPAGGGMEGSVSTVPCSFKEFIHRPEQVDAMRRNLWRCVEHISELSEKTGKLLHLGLEPEPLCYLETTAETVEFFRCLKSDRSGDDRLSRHLGVNYDACHLAVEYEDAREGLAQLMSEGILISKLHLSSALKATPTQQIRSALGAFVDPVYLHQVVERRVGVPLRRIRDLDVALREAGSGPFALSEEKALSTEWRIHFHVPLHCAPSTLWGTTSNYLQDVFGILQENPGICKHLEMETYTWEVMPTEMKHRDVVTQLVEEYEWTLSELKRRGMA